jgi:hypothetical protein
VLLRADLHHHLLLRGGGGGVIPLLPLHPGASTAASAIITAGRHESIGFELRNDETWRARARAREGGEMNPCGPARARAERTKRTRERRGSRGNRELTRVFERRIGRAPPQIGGRRGRGGRKPVRWRGDRGKVSDGRAREVGEERASRRSGEMEGGSGEAQRERQGRRSGRRRVFGATGGG